MYLRELIDHVGYNSHRTAFMNQDPISRANKRLNLYRKFKQLGKATQMEYLKKVNPRVNYRYLDMDIIQRAYNLFLFNRKHKIEDSIRNLWKDRNSNLIGKLRLTQQYNGYYVVLVRKKYDKEFSYNIHHVTNYIKLRKLEQAALRNTKVTDDVMLLEMPKDLMKTIEVFDFPRKGKLLYTSY